MKINTVTLMIGGAIVTAIVGLVLIFKNTKGSGDGKKLSEDDINKKETEPTKATGDGVTGSKDKLKSDDFPLKSGSRGYYPLMIQARLNYLFSAGLKMDGIMGEITIRAILKYRSLLKRVFWASDRFDDDWMFKKEAYDEYLISIKEKTGGVKAYYKYLINNEKTLNAVLTLYGLKLSPDIYKIANS